MIFRTHPQLEAHPDSKKRAFVLYSFSKPRFDFIWHHHPEVELTHIIEGYGVRYIGNSILPFRAGDLCLIGAGVPHAYGSHPQMEGKAKWKVLHFRPESFGPDFWKLPECRAFVRLLQAARRGVHFHGSEISRCVHCIENLQREKDEMHAMAIFFKIFSTVARLKRRTFLNTEIQEEGNIDPRLQKVLTWLDTEEADCISHERAARLIGMIPAGFSRFFRAQTGKAFVDYLNEMRVARACAKLSTGEHSITEIAFAAGFRNLPNFNRRFKEITGVTPMEYRKGLPKKN